MSDPEQITHVALRLRSGRVFKLAAPARHGDVISYMASMVDSGDIASVTYNAVRKMLRLPCFVSKNRKGDQPVGDARVTQTCAAAALTSYPIPYPPAKVRLLA